MYPIFYASLQSLIIVPQLTLSIPVPPPHTFPLFYSLNHHFILYHIYHSPLHSLYSSPSFNFHAPHLFLTPYRLPFCVILVLHFSHLSIILPVIPFTLNHISHQSFYFFIPFIPSFSKHLLTYTFFLTPHFLLSCVSLVPTVPFPAHSTGQACDLCLALCPGQQTYLGFVRLSPANLHLQVMLRRRGSEEMVGRDAAKEMDGTKNMIACIFSCTDVLGLQR